MIQSEPIAKPDWLKIKIRSDLDFSKIKNALKKRNLVTVCEEANCPNMADCWSNEGTATFMVLGDTCTRGCKFCAIKTSVKGQEIDLDEPIKLAEAISEMELDYAVLTAVDRDDLEDGGAEHFANCIKKIKELHPKTIVEVLIGDFAGDFDALQKVIDAKPDVIAHNVETVKRLQKKVRDLRATYEQSLSVLKRVKDMNPTIYTKSSLMLGLSETQEEVFASMLDLKSVNCDIVTFGQYMKPKNKILKVEEYVTPEQFDKYKVVGEKLGFLYVASGPFVRSSYKAGELFIKNQIRK